MARKTKRLEPLFDTNSKGKIEKNDDPVPTVEDVEIEERTEEAVENQPAVQELEQEEAEETTLDDDYIQRFKKAKLKMETHIPFNTRIPKTLRKRIDVVEKYYTGGRKNTGFLQEFVANALYAELEKAERQMQEEKAKRNKKS